MAKKSFLFVVGWLSLTSISACATNSWITDFPRQDNASNAFVDVPFIQIPVSRLNVALDRLDEKQYKVLDKNLLKYYVGNVPIEIESKFIILIRSVFTNGGTGKFSARQADDVMWVNHSSLGRDSEVNKSALVVFTDMLPKVVYVTSDGAE